MSDIEITETSRGLHIYGEPVVTSYGDVVSVYESSAASGPCCWLRIEQVSESAAHLNLEQAVAIRDRLDAFISEAPARWAAPEGTEA